MERVDKLRTITVERGATRHEQDTARGLAIAIGARYGLQRPAAPAAAGRHAHDCRSPIAAAYARSTRTDRRAAGSRRFVVFA